jgi:glycosyltransferase involved in cell wall biosynthesis
VRYHLLEWGHRRTFNNAAGTIFLTSQARDTFVDHNGQLEGQTTIIPHGVSERFACENDNDVYRNFEDNVPFRWLYVSPVKLYKHQWNVVEAVDRLRKEGYPVELDLVGGAEPKAMEKLRRVFREIDSNEEAVRYHGGVSHERIGRFYRTSDAFVFASTCETFGQVLTEAMQAGLPIACSNRTSAPEVVQDGAVYFDPNAPSEVAGAMRKLMDNPELRKRKVRAAQSRVENYSWERCARETFSFIIEATQS